MKMRTIQTYFESLKNVKLAIDITSNRYNFNLNDVFEVGVRVNPKRTFLFISKLLGKHLSVNPNVPRATGYVLASLIAKQEDNRECEKADIVAKALKTGVFSEAVISAMNTPMEISANALVIGFAETATGLGQGVAIALEAQHYIQTTRKVIEGRQSIFDFEEEHSHATSHRCYLEDEAKIEDAEVIILVDDEITTGKTSLNLIESIDKKYPGKRYIVASLLDWRSKRHQDEYVRFEQEKGIRVDCISLVSGELEVIKDVPVTQFNHPSIQVGLSDDFPCMEVGLQGEVLTGTNYRQMLYDIERKAKGMALFLNNKVLKDEKKILCLGTEEFIYNPSRVASYLQAFRDVDYKTTTRSPIYLSNRKDYPIKSVIPFKVADGSVRYVYNIKENEYDAVVIFSDSKDRADVRSLVSGLRSMGIKEVIVMMG